jgi:hypothetical protein
LLFLLVGGRALGLFAFLVRGPDPRKVDPELLGGPQQVVFLLADLDVGAFLGEGSASP